MGNGVLGRGVEGEIHYMHAGNVMGMVVHAVLMSFEKRLTTTLPKFVQFCALGWFSW